MVRFHMATEEEIKKGLTTDIYFQRTRDILRKKGIRKKVVAEFTYHSTKIDWVVFAGLEEVVKLLEGIPVNLYALPEGTIFTPFSKNGVPVPVMVIEGCYDDFAVYETPALGFICQASGIATRAAKLRLKAWDKLILSFGVRRMHPAIAPMIDRAAYIGGCDGFSSVIASKFVKEEAKGTMPHALMLVMGEDEAWRAFDETMPENVPRIALIDTFNDEKFAAIKAAEIFRNLHSVRLDTPSSRRGNFKDIIQEVRWELNSRGHKNVKIFVSGGIDEKAMEELADVVDGFGVGTYISNAPTVDYAMDIVEVEGKPLAKRGKYSGRKEVFRKDVLEYYVYLQGSKGFGEKMLKKYVENGEIVEELPTAKEIREYVMRQLEKIRNHL